MNFDFGEVLTRAWQIAWRHKVLWLGGIVIGFLGFLSLPINLLTNQSFLSFQSTHPNEIGQEMWLPLLGTGLIIILSILSIPINVAGMALPSLGTIRVEQGTDQLNFVELVKGTFPYFWRILGIFLLVGLGFFVVMGVFFACIALLSIATLGMGVICAFPLFIVLIPLVILIYAIVEQAMSAILVDNLGMSNALQFAWDLVRKNLGVMALLSIIIYIGSAVVSMIISVPMMIPMFSMIFRMGTTQPDIQSMEKLFRNMTWWMLAFSPVYILFQGFLFAFIQSTWTLTYMRLTRKSDSGTPVTPSERSDPVQPEDSNKTLIAREPTDDNKTIMAKKPDA